MITKKLCLALLFVLASFATVFSVSFDADFTTINDRIFIDEIAEFQLEIRNRMNSEQRYSVFSADPGWNVYVEGSQVILAPGESKIVTVLLDPTSSLEQGRKYGVPIGIRSLFQNEVDQHILDVTINSGLYRTFQPSIFVDVVVGDNNEVDPSRPLDATVRLINRNR